MEIISHGGWKNNVRLANESVEIVATLDVGPRIIRFAAPGGPNLFKEYKDQLGKAGEKQWMIRGGHRFWESPENPKRTCFR